MQDRYKWLIMGFLFFFLDLLFSRTAIALHYSSASYLEASKSCVYSDNINAPAAQREWYLNPSKDSVVANRTVSAVRENIAAPLGAGEVEKLPDSSDYCPASGVFWVEEMINDISLPTGIEATLWHSKGYDKISADSLPISWFSPSCFWESMGATPSQEPFPEPSTMLVWSVLVLSVWWESERTET